MAGKSAKSRNRGPIGGYNVSGKMVSYHSIDGGDVIAPTASQQGMQASGGVITDYTESGPGNTYRVHTFTSSGTFVISSTDTNIPDGDKLEYLIIGGGGGCGDGDYSAGGGAGGFRTNVPGHPTTESNPITASAATYPIIVGGGGSRGSSGAASTAFGYVSNGGGRGAGGSPALGALPGGSGGGGGWLGNGIPKAAGNGTAGQGNPGGTGSDNAAPQAGHGGGGGAGGAGTTAEGSTYSPGSDPTAAGCSGTGGIGTSINFAGIEQWFCGGGGGGGHANYLFNQGIGGKGGGGCGGMNHASQFPEEGPNPNRSGENGHESTGGGGGGGKGPTGAGGSGRIQVRYRINPSAANPGIKATGGHVFKDVGNSKVYHVFTAPGSFTNPESIAGAEILLIGGGGGGGCHATSYGGSGGGGAGGVLHLASPATMPANTYSVGVGTGGNGGYTEEEALNGGDSTILCPPIGLNVTATGGGSGRQQLPGSPPGAGGSGGGGGYSASPAGGPGTQTDGPSPIGTFSGYGNNGGTALTGPEIGNASFTYPGGGGGGAGGSSAAGIHVGGAGREFPTFSADFLPGIGGYYAAGGGSSGSFSYAAAPSGPRGKGGIGGGGAGGDVRGGDNDDTSLNHVGASGFLASPGVDYTGSGGGAGGCSTPILGDLGKAGSGGHGVCIISYPSA